MIDNLPVPPQIQEFIRSYRSFVVVGHKEPDGDCIGSQLALASLLRRSGKDVVLINPGPFERQEILPEKESFSSTIDPEHTPQPEAVFVVDCSSADRIGAVADQIRNLPVAVIDHHASGERFGDVHFIRPDLPATTILVYALFRAIGMDLIQQDAQLLFLGLATDTGFFRFLSTEQHVAYTVAAELTRAGASPREVDNRISTGRSMESRRLLARLLQRVEELREGAFLLTFQTLADEKEFGSRRDSDALYKLLLAVEGVRAVALIKEKTDGCAVSFRALDDTDVGKLAARFGGGGHQKAAGAFGAVKLSVFLSQVRSALLELE
jgi:bifunctional oligoribonuclease and PAP phosphatase NrnA